MKKCFRIAATVLAFFATVSVSAQTRKVDVWDFGGVEEKNAVQVHHRHGHPPFQEDYSPSRTEKPSQSDRRGGKVTSVFPRPRRGAFHVAAWRILW